MALPFLPAADPRDVLAGAVLASGWWRYADERPHLVEWMHFVVVAADVRLLANFSVRREGGRARFRLLRLLYAEGRWTGDLVEIEPREVELRAGRVDAFFGDSYVRFVDGTWRVRLAPAGAGIAAELRLRPAAAPLVATNLRLPGGARFHWTGVPRLVVEQGRLTAPFARDLAGCAAYHDHNWGSFATGQDLVWEWAFGLPAADRDPWSCLALRVSDRSRHHTLVSGVAAWRDGHLWREFRDGEVAWTREGRSTRPPDHRLPAELDAAAFAASLPGSCTWAARAGGDHLEAVVEPLGHAQLLLPAGEHLASVAEAAARVRLRGSLRGRPVDAALLGMLEVVDG